MTRSSTLNPPYLELRPLAAQVRGSIRSFRSWIILVSYPLFPSFPLPFLPLFCFVLGIRQVSLELPDKWSSTRAVVDVCKRRNGIPMKQWMASSCSRSIAFARIADWTARSCLVSLLLSPRSESSPEKSSKPDRSLAAELAIKPQSDHIEYAGSSTFTSPQQNRGTRPTKEDRAGNDAGNADESPGLWLTTSVDGQQKEREPAHLKNLYTTHQRESISSE